MPNSSVKLPLTLEEKAQLRTSRIKVHDIANMSSVELAQCSGISLERSKYLRALAIFQSIPSIGPKVSQKVVDLGYYSLEEIKNMEGYELINRWEEKCGYWEDPCLEDAFRCIVHHANHLRSDKSWFDFTEERKEYRRQFGYPDTRPHLAWHEVRK